MTLLMSHLVACYPDLNGSLRAAAGLINGGSSYLEVQFPFSDPVADGPAIQHACAAALQAGFTLEGGFRLLDRIGRRVPVFVMCYANTVFFHGVERFVERCAAHGVHGLIVPDLPVDQDEGLYGAGAAHGVHVVPVVSPAVGGRRLALIMARARPYVYTALRRGITGARTTVDEASVTFLERVRAARPGGPTGNEGPKILAGFGVSRPEQVAALSPQVHAVIAGSVFVRAIGAAAGGGPEAVYHAARCTAAELLGENPEGELPENPEGGSPGCPSG